MREPWPLHRLFGLSWTDFCRETAIAVETEIDLSLKQQFLDVLLLRRGVGPLPRLLPDGFEDLATYNLLTFKSYQETLDRWALLELLGHYVNYRKQVSPSLQALLPESDFRLFAVCARSPHNLAQQVAWTALRAGVYEVQLLELPIRIIVINELPQAEQNAMLHLFSAQAELLRYGREHYRPRSTDTSTLVYQLFKAYSEDPTMPDKLKEFVRQSIDELLQSLPAEELRKHLSPAERLEGLPAEERLKGLSTEEVLRALSPEAREALARQLKNGLNHGPS